MTSATLHTLKTQRAIAILSGDDYILITHVVGTKWGILETV
jgi:hypothetical protein